MCHDSLSLSMQDPVAEHSKHQFNMSSLSCESVQTITFSGNHNSFTTTWCYKYLLYVCVYVKERKRVNYEVKFTE